MIGRSKLLIGVLAVAVLLGTGWLAYGWIGGENEDAPAQTAAVAAPKQAEDELAFGSEPVGLPPADAFVEIVRRPIFSPDRRPAPEGELTLETAASGLEVNLVGIIIASGQQMALIAPRGSPTLVRLAQGDRFQGWTVDTIEAHRVRFRRDEVVHDIEISYDQPPTVVPARPAAAREPEPPPAQNPEKEQQ